MSTSEVDIKVYDTQKWLLSFFISIKYMVWVRKDTFLLRTHAKWFYRQLLKTPIIWIQLFVKFHSN